MLKSKRLNTTGILPLEISPISKTVVTYKGEVLPGLSVETHCKITGFVAKELSEIIIIDNTKNLFPCYTPFISAIHDVGKISPCFQRMIYEHVSDFDLDKYPELLPYSSVIAGRNEKAFHGTVTEAAVKESSIIKDNVIPIIEGMHHGFKPADAASDNSEIYGGKAWSELRQNLVKKMQHIFLFEDQSFLQIESWQKACVLGGLITVSDWIASGGEFAKLEYNSNKSDEDLKLMAQSAVRKAGFERIEIKHDLAFTDIFGFEPKKVQVDFYKSVKGNGVYILEAPMGMGKTEAALYASYRVLEQGMATGIYFALPTQLTSNKIYERVKSFLKKICNREENEIELKLLHSAAWLEEKTLGEEGSTGQSWFDSNKRGLLAPFAVGTIDQALMSVMNVRHGMVRAFGLAGKVVILDEVHSYDSYTGTIIKELVTALQEENCTVIILSATLTEKQKRNLLGIESKNINSTKKGYPLITTFNKYENKINEISSESTNNHTVQVNVTDDVNQTLELVLEKAENKEQILWIENTVSEAQSIYKMISSRTKQMNVECGLIHSRFIKNQRATNEDYWVSLFGKNATENRKKKGRILIGTQVLEQSIDIDADFLVTRICPTDMILQRMGRLYRHPENNTVRPKTSSCSTVILAPNYDATLSKENCFDLSSYVYSEYVLCRTLEIWKDKKIVKIPLDIRQLLESTYSEREEKERLSKLKNELINKARTLQQAAFIGLSKIGKTLPESVAQTRYSEIESISVLVLKSFIRDESEYRVWFLNEEKISIPKKCYSENQKKKIAKKILENCVVVSSKDAPPVDREIQLFSPYVYVGNNSTENDESPFRVVIVGDDEKLRSLSNVRIEINNKDILYNLKLGYQTNKCKKGGKL